MIPTMQRLPVEKRLALRRLTMLIARSPVADDLDPPDLAAAETLEMRSPNSTWTN
jgi:hypothetical protein